MTHGGLGMMDRTSPAMILTSEDLPTPFGPITPRIPPGGTSNERSRKSTRPS